MAFTLEDGSGIAGSNAYVSESDLESYADDRSVTLADGDESAAIVRATIAFDAIYRARFNGYKTHGRNQGLEWPRTAAYDREGYLISGSLIPPEVKAAVCEMAIRELTEPGSMLPDLERGGQINELSAGSVRIVYGANAQATTTFQLIDKMLSGLLGSPFSTLAGISGRG
jgi:hypothetical protein